MHRNFLVGALSLALCAGISAARAADCPGNPNALGTSRTLVVDPHEHNKIGTMSYAETLPLADREVVLTFDDGPIPPYTNRVLDILAAECVHATYFIVGEMAKAYPDAVRRIYAAGHTIGTHSWSHPIHFRAQTFERAKAQIDGGIDATVAALGDPDKVAPFFRFPGFGFTVPAEEYAASRGLMVWGADVPADDWYNIGPKEVAARAIRRLEAKGKGILLLHDIHERTVEALPIILRELKARGFRVVHVVPSGPDRPATVTAAAEWRLKGEAKPEVPVILMASLQDIDGESVINKSAAELCSINPPRHDMFKIGLRKRTHAAHVAQHVAQHVEKARDFRPDIHAVQ
jgi:peptidoglycan/xylan/chitin deacetylase (PgdA/CDA1 family)